MVKSAIFIEWDDSEEERNEKLDHLYQKQFTIDRIIIHSSKRSKTLSKWQNGLKCAL